ncbi:unnamed protein product [Prunus armeniaca]|uniref:Uncharacterized protein n=1 Tax=Prunus armeniaca TaxID=36596 RepID=A0A6J5W0I0_PRUAR|nr:hypothetical protein GBA52_003045 [Prunus armeniaca]CAB4295090.1 unnamed protein product [Prunus armeniaca]
MGSNRPYDTPRGDKRDDSNQDPASASETKKSSGSAVCAKGNYTRKVEEGFDKIKAAASNGMNRVKIAAHLGLHWIKSKSKTSRKQ